MIRSGRDICAVVRRMSPAELKRAVNSSRDRGARRIRKIGRRKGQGGRVGLGLNLPTLSRRARGRSYTHTYVQEGASQDFPGLVKRPWDDAESSLCRTVRARHAASQTHAHKCVAPKRKTQKPRHVGRSLSSRGPLWQKNAGDKIAQPLHRRNPTLRVEKQDPHCMSRSSIGFVYV